MRTALLPGKMAKEAQVHSGDLLTHPSASAEQGYRVATLPNFPDSAEQNKAKHVVKEPWSF